MEPPIKIPSVSQLIVEYLNQVFPLRLPEELTSSDTVALQVARVRGQRDVVEHLFALHTAQQEENPLNVHENA